MNRITASITQFGPAIALLGLFFPESVAAQNSAPANSLTRALATFSAADVNKDGKVSADEISTIPIGRGDFQAQDFDRDGSWSKDEFLVFYRQRLMLAGQSVGSDLEAETARIQAVRKAKAAEEAKVKATRTQGAVKAAQPATVDNNVIRSVGPAAGAGAAVAANPSGPSLAAIEAALQSALDSLEKRAAAAQASRDDFQKVHDQLVARARAAANPNGPSDGAAVDGSDAYTKMIQSLERLEKRAAEGVYSREDYQAFRDMIIHRSRLVAGKTGSEDKGGPDATSPDLAAIETGLHNALDALEKRAAGGHASREDFQAVRDQLIARARAAASAGAPSSANGAQGSDTYQKMLQSLDRLEKRAAEGGYSREEYQELREQFVHRAREIQGSKSADVASPIQAPQQSAPPAAKSDAPPVQREKPPATTEPVRNPSTPPPPAPAPQETAPKPQRPTPPAETPPKAETKPDAQRPPR